jgi:hypothetical protein
MTELNMLRVLQGGRQAYADGVAQIFNLLYRRFVTSRTFRQTRPRRKLTSSDERNSAPKQAANLRSAPRVVLLVASLVKSAGLALLAGTLNAAEPTPAPAAPPVASPALRAAPTNANDGGVVRFFNGDALRGALRSIDTNQQVRWESSLLHAPTEFTVADVARMRFSPLPSPRRRAQADCVVRLINSDELQGHIVSLDARNLVFDTWYAGTLTIPRASVAALRFSETSGFSYEGPTGLEGWTLSESQTNSTGQSWGYARGTFYGKRAGGIARDLKLPDRAAIDVDVTWRDFLQLTITIYTESLRVYQLGQLMFAGFGQAVLQGGPAPEQKGAGFYAVQFSMGGTYLMTVRKNGSIANSPIEQVPAFSQKNRARLGLRVDKQQKTLSLLVDGNLIKTWQDSEEFAGVGTAVRFVQQGQAPVNLRNIRVAEWDGSFPNPLADKAPARTNDFVSLKNYDSVAGRVQGIRDEAMTLTADFGEVRIPLDRLTDVDFALPVAREARTDGAPPAGADLVRAHFAERGVLTFKLEEWRGNMVVARSPHFGQARFQAEAFSGLDFNLHRRPPSELE